MEFLSAFINLYIEMAPYLALGLFVAGILHVVVNRQFILNNFGKQGIGSVIRAAVVGVPLPLCSCSVVPTALSLKKHGASNGATISFLISTPQTGVDSIAATAGMMGPLFAFFRPFVAFVTGIIGGSIVAISEKKSPESVVLEPVQPKPKRSFMQSVRELFRYGFGELMDDIGPNLIVGILISALISILIPESFFTKYIGNSFLEMIIVMIGAIPLYVCATASIPIAAVLMMKGMSAGAAFVFLMAGPATNAATIAVLYSKLGKKLTTIYLVVIAVSAFAFGTILNAGYELFDINPMAAMNHDHGEHEKSPWMIIFAVIFTIPLAWSIWKTKLKVPLFRLLRKGVSKNSSVIRVYKVGGLSCQKCVAKVTDIILMIPNTATASIDFEKMELTVCGDVSESVICEAVQNAGYQCEGVIRSTELQATS